MILLHNFVHLGTTNFRNPSFGAQTSLPTTTFLEPGLGFSAPRLGILGPGLNKNNTLIHNTGVAHGWLKRRGENVRPHGTLS